MHGRQQAFLTIVHLWSALILIRTVIAPSLYQSTGSSISTHSKDYTVIPGEDALTHSSPINHDLEGVKVEVGSEIHSHKKSPHSNTEDHPQDGETSLGSSSLIDRNDGPREPPNVKAKSSGKKNQVNLSGEIVEVRPDALIKLEDVFGISRKTQKGKHKETGKYTMPNESPQRVSDRIAFLRAHVPEELMATWYKKQHDLRLLFLMAAIMRIDNPQIFGGIVQHIQAGAYQVLKSYWLASESRWLLMEAEISKIFKDRLEPARRILAFRRLLHHHTAAKRWASIANPLFRLGGQWRDEVVDIQRAYGISTDPKYVVENAAEIPTKKWDPDCVFGPGKFKIRKMLVDVFGETEAKRRQDLHDYKMNRVRPNLWYRQTALNNAQSLGVDILSVWKIGDALQFGSKLLPCDSAFAQIFKVMTASDSHFSWFNSPERVWLFSNYGEVFLDRLATLSHSIILSEHRNPLSTAAVENLVGEVGMVDGSYGRGLEIIKWCDLGLDPKEWARIRQIRNSRDQEEFVKLNMEMGKITGMERQKFELWHLFITSYYARADRHTSIVSKTVRCVSQWVDRQRTPLTAYSQLYWMVLKAKIDQLIPRASWSRNLRVMPGKLFTKHEPREDSLKMGSRYRRLKGNIFSDAEQ
ncbi:hypothetical protein Pst134EB_010231 [Puccinia striiformis f. sp. tritici]|nr:hypothetical protein Pst134EB_010231 [Puccinia striiformis f. sp. tritici]